MSSSRIKATRSTSKKGLFKGLSFKKSIKAKAGASLEATLVPGDQALQVVDISGGKSAAAGEQPIPRQPPVPRQPFVVVSGMTSSSGDVPSARTEGGDSARSDEADASEVATGDLPAEVEATIGGTATKAPDTPAATAHAVDFAQVPGEVLRVGVAGSRSISSDDPAASAADSGPAPVEEASVPKPILGDLAVDVTTPTGDIVAKAPDTSSRGDKETEETKEGMLSTKEASSEAKIETKAATKPVPAGKKRYVVVSGYVPGTTSDGGGLSSVREVDARSETKADGAGENVSDTASSLEAKKPKKGLFGGVFGSSKALSKPQVAGGRAISGDGFQPVSDLSVDMGDHTSDKTTGTETRVGGCTAKNTPSKTPSVGTNKPK